MTFNLLKIVYLTFNYSYMNGQINLIVNGQTEAGVTVSLSISAEGSIGIATAGVGAGIEVSWKPKQ
jgi:hypothetical protein